MPINQSYYIGLMSGTSTDSIDAALVDFSDGISVVSTHTGSIPNAIKQKIIALATPGDSEILRMRALDYELGHLFAQAALTVCNAAGVAPSAVKAIGNHGQTIRHYPASSTQSGYSLQIADPNIICEQTGITTVADFRRRDIAAGGQGAPLVPAFHTAAFKSTEQDRIVINTGGIANLSYLPATSVTLGFDSGPANILMDAWCQKHRNCTYDDDGQWAKTGVVDQDLLSQLISHPYFEQIFPKSTGRETFNIDWLEQQLQRCNTTPPIEDVQATLLALTVESIGRATDMLDSSKTAEIYMCGGGAANSFLIQSLALRLSPRPLQTTSALGIDPDWVEATAFAWLAKQTLEHRSGNLPAVTGASKNVTLGGVYWKQ